MRRLVILLTLVLTASTSVALSGAVSAAGNGGGQSGYVTGGGRYDLAECPINFSVSAHNGPNGANGTQTATLSNAPGGIPGCPGQGHIKATVTCVAIDGNNAEIRGIITEQSGSLGPDAFPPGNVFVTDVQDNSGSGQPDRIQQSVEPNGTENDCVAPAFDEVFTVDHGDVTVHG